MRDQVETRQHTELRAPARYYRTGCNKADHPLLQPVNTHGLVCRAVAAEQQTGGHRSADDLEVGLTGARFGGAAGRRSRAAAQPPNEQDAVAAHHRRAEQPLVGQTGARFSAGLKRWRRRGPDSGRPESERPDSERTGTELRTTEPCSKTTGVERQPEITLVVAEP
ncbi:MAG: hypothetical protein QOG46_379, partial [Pseudonocardiales bacterium]|nr:hypothetical protein [Pseudonocardiales bacterium]